MRTRNRKILVWAICPSCKRQFGKKRWNQIYCTPSCKWKAWSQRHPHTEKRIRHRPWDDRKKLAALKRERAYMRFLAAWLVGRLAQKEAR